MEIPQSHHSELVVKLGLPGLNHFADMTLQYYLANRRWFEILIVTTTLVLIVLVNVSTLGIEHMRNGTGPGWREAWATELTSVAASGLLIPCIFLVLRKLQLQVQRWRQRILWLIPIFVGFSLLHIVLFVLLRKLLWTIGGGQYEFSPLLVGLIYEMRKDLLAFVALVIAYHGYQFIINRLQGEATFLGQADESRSAETSRQFLVKMLDREYLVKVEDIDWIQSASNYVVLHCGDRHYPMRQTLKAMLEQLDQERFRRVHRTAIINLDRVKALKTKGESQVTLQTGEVVPVSKTYMRQLEHAL